HIASSTALELLVTSSRACSAPPRTSVCKRLGGREQTPRQLLLALEDHVGANCQAGDAGILVPSEREPAL
ncbi:hypothetical protein KUCAC02_033634, partial [Chaenocephalus aceratus]